MQYQLTEVSNVTNAGYNSEVTLFDTFVEMQDYITAKTEAMTSDESELYMSYINIKPVFEEA